jgi:hypothetical protein
VEHVRTAETVLVTERRRRTINRLLILLGVVAVLGGLLLGQYEQVLLNALLLCYSCMGLG